MILALAIACISEPAPKAQAPAVVVIVTDTTRADLAGAPLPEWTRGGRVYGNAYGAAPYTTASTAALVTGRYPVGAERYEPTRHFSKCWNMDQGEPTVYPWPANAWPDLVLTDHPVVARLSRAERAAYAGPGASSVYQAGIDALDEGGHKAVYIHALGPHEPYAGLPEGWERTTPDKLVATLSWCGGLPADLAGWARWQYRAAVEHTLADVGPLVVAALRTGAVVIWTADHGEALGEGDRWGHGRSLDDEQIRVPLVVWGPGVTPGTDPTPVPATCVGQTARLVLSDTTPGLCDIRTGDIIGGPPVAGMMQGGTWDERVILPQAASAAP